MFKKFIATSAILVASSFAFMIAPANAGQVGGPSGAIFCPQAPGGQISYGGKTGKTAQQAAAECRELGGTPRILIPNQTANAMPKGYENIALIAPDNPSNPIPDIEVKCNDGMSAWWNPGWPTGNTEADAVAICNQWHGGVKPPKVRPRPIFDKNVTLNSQVKNDVAHSVKDNSAPIIGHDHPKDPLPPQNTSVAPPAPGPAVRTK